MVTMLVIQNGWVEESESMGRGSGVGLRVGVLGIADPRLVRGTRAARRRARKPAQPEDVPGNPRSLKACQGTRAA